MFLALRHRYAPACLAVACLAHPAFAADQILVRFKDSLAKQAASDRFDRLGQALGEALTPRRTTHDGTWVVSVATRGESTHAILQQLVRQPDIAYAELDRYLYPQFTPNDRLFAQQWEMAGSAGSIRATAAWDITTGSSNIVIAIADTGIRPHAQLAGRILPGYDFVSSDPDGVPFRANDGDGRDADASDPGDWVTQADLVRLAQFPEIGDDTGCRVTNSSWHGTRVAGIAAARGNDGLDSAGVNWNSRILPIRVLGKCGERTSDVADGIAWAAGLAVPGIPVNPNPAHVVNVSLGATGTCSQLMSDTFKRALEGPTMRAIVVAAGNSARDYRDFTPANCPYAISVAAIGRNGEIASYSNFGNVTISAPGGASSGAMVNISNSGTTTPGSDTTTSGNGTSFAAPMVAGVVSLMLSVNADLSAEQVRRILTQSARPFVSATCSFARCGAGMLDALDAVRLAQTTTGEGGGKAYANRPRMDGTDLWVADGESGWGLNLTQHASGQVFGVLYTYGADGRPQWYTLPGGNWASDSDMVGLLYRAAGPTPADAWVARAVSAPTVGSFKLSYVSENEIVFTTIFGTQTATVRRLRRLAFQ